MVLSDNNYIIFYKYIYIYIYNFDYYILNKYILLDKLLHYIYSCIAMYS